MEKLREWKDKIIVRMGVPGEVCDGARRLEGRKSVAWAGLLA